MPPALAGRFSTTAPPGKPPKLVSVASPLLVSQGVLTDLTVGLGLSQLLAPCMANPSQFTKYSGAQEPFALWSRDSGAFVSFYRGGHGPCEIFKNLMDGKMCCKLNNTVPVGPFIATDSESLMSPAKLDPSLMTTSVPLAP